MIRAISRWGTLVSVLLLISMIFLSGCGTSSTTQITQPSSTTAVTSVTSTASPASTEVTETLKIGLLVNMSSNVSLDLIHAIEVQVGVDNSNGFLNIGGTKYKIDLIKYDSGGNQATEVAAVNRFVFQDNVKFIISEGAFAPAWLPVTEQQKVVTFISALPAQLVLTPNYHYSFNASFIDSQTIVVSAYYFNQHPEAKSNVVMAFPDDLFGHMASTFVDLNNKIFNIPTNNIFFPANVQDLSSLATKVAIMNPTVFGCVTESDTQTGQVMNAIREAGYKGQFMIANSIDSNALLKVMNPDTLQGFICAAMPTEFDPPLTPEAKEFKAAWINKYGSWGSPSVAMAVPYWALRTALVQAGTVDSEKVASVIGSGLKFDSPMGSGEMVSRPDLGNERTVDSVATFYIKQMEDGKPTLVATIPLDESLKLFKTATPPGAGGPPPGMSGPPPGAPPP